MSFESGGRADKAGNSYEIRYCVCQLLKVIEEKIANITIEAIGDDEKGVDVWIEHNDGTREGQQCKARFKNNDNWSASSLKSYNIFQKWKYQLDRNSNINVSIVSPLSFVMLEDIIKRANNSNGNPEDFYNFQIKSSTNDMIDLYNKFCEGMEADINTSEGLAQSFNYIKRVKYRQFPDDSLEEIIKDKISYLFIGNESIIYNAFINLILTGEILGKKIDKFFLNEFINKNNIILRNLNNDKSIIPAIERINREFKQFFYPINNILIEREEFYECKELIENEKSIIIHGKAGNGKSGVTQMITNYCESSSIPYIAINLNDRMPEKNIDEWSKNLGLPTSIAFSLNSISLNRKAVIILDQLDGLRWTNKHSRDALLICGNLIEQVRILNLERVNKISIIFVCRTYDLENDNIIKSLFKKNENDNNICWTKVEIKELTDECLQKVVGKKYYDYSIKLRKILRKISNLYIWTKLDNKLEFEECTTTNNLIEIWWRQLLRNSNEYGINENELKEAKTKIINNLEKDGKMNVLLKVVDLSEIVLNYLCSNGALLLKNNSISFTHQSIYDFFIEEKMLQDYKNGKTIEEIIGIKDKQIPSKKYQVQMLLEEIAMNDTSDFIKLGIKILDSINIRFYIKYTFFEVLGQIIELDYNIENFILEYCENENYGKYILTEVLMHRPKFIRILMNNGIIDRWIKNGKKEVAFNLLQSIKPNYIKEDIEFINNYFFINEEDDKILFYCFNYDINDDIPEMFELRLKFYQKYPELSDRFVDMKKMLISNEIRAIKLIKFWIENDIKNNKKSLYKYETELIDEKSDIIVNNDQEIIDELLPLVPIDDKAENSNWNGRYVYKLGIERVCIELIKKANVNLIKRDLKRFIEIYTPYMGKMYVLLNEIILDGLEKFPINYADYVISYLCENLENNSIFDYTSGNKDELLLTKKLLIKFSKYCSDKLFKKLEEKIYYYCENNMIEMYKFLKNIKMNSKKLFKDYWGNLQFDLLPCLEETKLSVKSKELIKMLNRKFMKGNTRFKYEIGHIGTVSSPLIKKKISDKAWCKLIVNKKLLDLNRHEWYERNNEVIEISLREFASDFSRATSLEPLRMIEIALNNSNDILPEFVDALYSGLSTSEKLDDVSIELLEKIFRIFPYDYKSQRARRMCFIIDKKNDQNWSESTFEMLKDIALHHEDPVLGIANVTTVKDSEINTIDMLQSNALNCTKGEVCIVLKNLLWDNSELIEKFKNTIECLVNDKNPVVKYASLMCLIAIYNHQKEWARERIIKLFEEDIRFVSFWYSKHILIDSFDEYKESISNIIKKCYNSDEKELNEVGSYCITELYLLKNAFEDIITNVKIMNDCHKRCILEMLSKYFNKNEYNEQVKNIIMLLKDNDINIDSFLVSVFRNKLLDIDRDNHFIKEVFIIKDNSYSIYSFANYLEEEAVNVFKFKDVIFNLVKRCLSNNTQKNLGYYDDELSKLIVRIYDETVDKNDLEHKRAFNECLNIWDVMYEKQIGRIRALTKDILDR